MRWGPPGLRIAPEVTFPDHAALAAAERWADLAFVEQTGALARRLYSCGCSHWETSVAVDLENDGESPSDPRVPWRCAGHPAPTLPLRLDHGLVVADGTRWDDLVDAVVKGARPRLLGLPRDDPSVWLAWLHHHLEGLPASEPLARAIVRRLDDLDPSALRSVLASPAGRPAR